MSKLYAGLSAIKDGEMNFSDVLLYYSDVPLSVFICEIALKKKKEGKSMARIMNQPTLDLRKFSVDALKKIKSITNVAMVILPEEITTEFSEAYAAIKKINIATEMSLPGSACFYNGEVTLTQNDIIKDSVIVCNGMAVIRDIPEEMNIKVIVNGTLIKSSSACIETVKINGAKYEIDDDTTLIKSIPKLCIDRNFINNLSKKTAIISCKKIEIDDEITDDMLRSKSVKFYSVAQISAAKELHGYIHANSTGVAAVLTKEEAEKREKGLRKNKRRWR